MYVGIIDQDLIQQVKFLPNLETMQISTYHKQKKDIVELVLTSQNIERYDKLYLIKNKNDKNFLPKVIADERTTCIGLGFNNGKFIPHSEFDSLTADTSIYNSFIEEHYSTMSKANQLRVNVLNKSDHFRVDLGNGKLNRVRAQHNRARIYDTNPIGIAGAEEIFDQYRNVDFVNPCYCDTFEEILKWLNKDWFMWENDLYFTGEFTDKEFKNFVNSYQKHKKAPIFTIDLRNTKNLQNEFTLWLERSLYALTRECSIKISVPYKCGNKFYDTLFSYIARWNNHRDRGKSFKNMAYNKTTCKEFDKLLKRDYNISRMVQIVPNQYKKESNWNYVNEF